MRVLSKLIEIIKTLAENYPNIDTEIEGNILRLKFSRQNEEYKELEVAENKAKLDVLIKSTKKNLGIKDVIELIKQIIEVDQL